VIDLQVPLDRQIWSAQQCATYLGQSYRQFIGRTQHAKGFPKRCPIPGHPRWQAQAVIDWTRGITSEPERTQEVTGDVHV
jgi:hypothetical protein